MSDNIDGMLQDIDDEIERELDNQDRQLSKTQANNQEWRQVLTELRTVQKQIEALHLAWLAQTTLLNRHTFPSRWVITILASMILTWVFSGIHINWR